MRLLLTLQNMYIRTGNEQLPMPDPGRIKAHRVTVTADIAGHHPEVVNHMSHEGGIGTGTKPIGVQQMRRCATSAPIQVMQAGIGNIDGLVFRFNDL